VYLQITSRCNMSCEHCCFSCGPHGRHMPVELAKEAVRNAFDDDDDVPYGLTIGGGEPTLHPQFEEILAEVLLRVPRERIYIVTNGSHKER